MHKKQIRRHVHASQMCKEDRQGACPAPPQRKAGSFGQSQRTGQGKKCVAGIRAIDAFGLEVVGLEPSLSVEDGVLSRENALFQQLCGNHRDCLICQMEEKTPNM